MVLENIVGENIQSTQIRQILTDYLPVAVRITDNFEPRSLRRLLGEEFFTFGTQYVEKGHFITNVNDDALWDFYGASIYFKNDETATMAILSGYV